MPKKIRTISMNLGHAQGDRSAKEYFEELVVPLCDRALLEPRSDYLYNASIVVVWHTIDWIGHGDKAKIEEVLRILESIEPRIKYLHAAANASKHYKISRSPKEHVGLVHGLTRSYTITTEIKDYAIKTEAHAAPVFIFDDGVRISGPELLNFSVNAFKQYFQRSS